ncbi:DUF4252 domain-containing protein [Sphingobacteriaceae bacterium WQ 2009]|uniref:DUF4252 domain-containing protein n=1 Tax=Rhinopithecimicrobium faecis TaxID=2820698 RepID=A0A8T4H9R0_9SPHI|nr:DUF4252 domain-containing protein [Sphingobacteriaceae bacterium WQ 2009]
MKTLLFIISFFAATIAQAQENNLDQIFEKYKQSKGVTSIKIGKPMFTMLNKMKINDADLQLLKPLLSKINSIKMLIFEDSDAAVQAQINESLNKLKYQELMTINSEKNNINFRAEDTDGDLLKNLFLTIVSDNTTIFMILDGSLKYEDINTLVANK